MKQGVRKAEGKTDIRRNKDKAFCNWLLKECNLTDLACFSKHRSCNLQTLESSLLLIYSLRKDRQSVCVCVHEHLPVLGPLLLVFASGT